MNALQILLHSKAFWTAVLSAVGLVALKYLNFPEDIWNAILGILIVVIGVFTADDASKAYARATVAGMRDAILEFRSEDEERLSNLAMKLSKTEKG